MSDFLVYGLICPFTDEIRYIGKSTTGLTRPLSHLSKSHSQKINDWINELKNLHSEPGIIVLEECNNEIILKEKEKFWIYKYVKDKALLLNISYVTSASLLTRMQLDPDQSDSLFSIRDFIKRERKKQKMKQPELAKGAKVGLRFIRDLEQGKKTLRLDKVSDVLEFLGGQLLVKKNIDTSRHLP